VQGLLDSKSAGEAVLQPGHLSHEGGVRIRSQAPGQGARQLGHVVGEQQASLRTLGPAPQGDVVEEVANGQHAGVDDAGRDLAVPCHSPPPRPAAVPDEVVPASLFAAP